MDSMPVNWEALDALVIDFAKSERLIEDSNHPSPPTSPPSSSSPSSSSPSSLSYQSRLLIRQIRRSLEAGEIDAAVDLLRTHAPSVLDDHRLLFRLQKQKFIELLRKGTAEDRDAAIKCIRTALAPCALDAYPEAYAEFKHVLLAFVYDKDDQTSPVAYEWSETRRFDIAGLFSSVLRAHLHAYDPVFAMSLRYLTSIHKGFCFRQGVSSPIADLTDRLLLEEHDPPATPQDCWFEAPPFDEVDIQALAHAVELTRQGAVDSLKFAKGDLFQAFQNELCRVKLDVSLLDELVHEYCVYRGIVDSGIALPSGECGNNKLSDDESSINEALMADSPADTNVVSMLSTDSEERYPGETTSSHEDCSTSRIHQSSNLKVMQRSRSHGIGERKKRKRWRGRNEKPDFISEVYTGSSVEELTSSGMGTLKGDLSKVEATSKRGDKYEILLGMKDLASRGMTAEVVEDINAVDPDFFWQNPVLLFQLKQVEFLTLVRSGDHSHALRVACTHLGPLAAKDPALLKPLKETLLALLRPNEEALGQHVPLQALATSLQVAVGRRLGIEEPQLMKIVRATLYTHSEWYKLQMCKDRFEGLLRINSLKEVGTPLLVDAASKSNIDISNHGSSEVTVSSSVRMPEDGNSPTQMSSGDLTWDENAILKVMEFLALPRADAIHLLSQYNGNAETVIQQNFA